MFTKIVAFFSGLFSTIKIFDKWFKPKTAGRKVEDETQEQRENTDEFKEDGRPKW